jgi:hypothetical protein
MSPGSSDRPMSSSISIRFVSSQGKESLKVIKACCLPHSYWFSRPRIRDISIQQTMDSRCPRNCRVYVGSKPSDSRYPEIQSRVYWSWIRSAIVLCSHVHSTLTEGECHYCCPLLQLINALLIKPTLRQNLEHGTEEAAKHVEMLFYVTH